MNNYFKVKWGKRAYLLMFFDVMMIALSQMVALWIRYDFIFSNISKEFFDNYLHYLAIDIVVTMVIYFFCHLYHSVWTQAGFNELWNITLAIVVSAGARVGLTKLTGWDFPAACYVMSSLIMYLATICARFFYRILNFLRSSRERIASKRRDGTKNVMVIGAGSAGKSIVDEILESTFVNYNMRCIIDDEKLKQGRFISGVPIVGTRDDIFRAVSDYAIDIIFIAIPSAKPEQVRDILQICKETGCELRILPGVYQLVNGEVSVSKFRKVEINDLLGREPIKVNLDEVMGYISNKTVIVTGGGGSIGSELCRQIAQHNPKRLIIFDVYENNAYNIQQELKRHCPDLDLVTLIGSVRNTKRLDSIFEKYKPDIVFHAAAHKHVPLMEDSPNEAIKNNVFGTYKTAVAAIKSGVKKFVLISTDKAVNPTNIMGASKRLCEMIVQMLDRRSETTEFVAVRFGNVLGSNGSVIPLFKKQIEEGGPVTVTDKRIIRYFMTIPEAVALVLQAGAYAKGGEIFVLEMGEPVKIDDLARNLIKLSGYTPDVDIKIEYVGLRPGEKLYEEMLMSEEGLKETANKLIHIGKPIEMDYELFAQQLKQLKRAAEDESDSIKQIVSEIVPTYVYKK